MKCQILLAGIFIGCSDIFITLPSWANELAPINSQLPQVNAEVQIQELHVESLESQQEIIVKEFEITGNTVIETKELLALIEDFKGKVISYNELSEAVTKVTRYYSDKGYFLSFAFLPPQELETGTIKIEVVEGYIADIEVKISSGALTPKYISERLEKIIGKPITLTELESALIVLKNQDLIQNFSQQIDKDRNTGLAILKLEVETADKFSLFARTDNWQSPFIGVNNRIASAELISLIKTGDRSIVGYRNSDGSNVLTAGYELPVNTSGGKIRILGGNNGSEIVTAPFNQPDPTTNFRFARGEFSQPVIESPENTLILTGAFNWQSSENFLLGEPFPFSRGADENGRSTVSSLIFSQEYIRRSNIDRIIFNSQLTLGVGLFDANTGSRFDSQFLIWRGDVNYLRLVSEDLRLLLRGGLQLSNDELPGLEQFTAGGPNTVRGYRAFLLSGDNGVLGSAEIQITLLKPKEDHTFQLIPFVDFAKPWNNSNDILEDNNLFSLGLELTYLIERNFEIRVGYGVPLTKIQSNNISGSLQEQGFFLSVTKRLF